MEVISVSLEAINETVSVTTLSHPNVFVNVSAKTPASEGLQVVAKTNVESRSEKVTVVMTVLSQALTVEK